MKEPRSSVELSGDLPRWIARRSRPIAIGARTIVALAIATQLADAAAWFDAPWTPLAMLYLSSAAIGVDAAIVGVRAEAERGPSIRNLTPGGWAFFAAMAWIVALPAYAFGAQRRRRALAASRRRPVGIGDALAIALVASMGVACAWLAIVSAVDVPR